MAVKGFFGDVILNKEAQSRGHGKFFTLLGKFLYTGNINSQRIIAMLTVKDDTLIVEEKGIYSIEEF